MSRRLIVVLLSVAFISACGREETGEPAADAPPQTDAARLEHVHGLDVDPATERVFVATHYGLFSASRNATRLERIGDSTQDIMGFNVASGGRFLGSGHPAPDQELPPLLGLIESSDGGRTWQQISLLGEADFHALESAGSRVYGFDATQGRLMVSVNGGRTWEQAAPPASVIDLATHPADPDWLVAATDAGLFVSRDAGRRWRPLDRDRTGFLEWVAPNRLYLVDGRGNVDVSTDGGGRFRSSGRLPSPPAAVGADGETLYAASGDGVVRRSSDGGRTWSVRAGP